MKAKSASAVANAEAEVGDILNGRHHVPSATADYTTRSSSSVPMAATSSNRTFTVLLASVACGISVPSFSPRPANTTA